MDIHPSHAALYLAAGFVIVSLVWRKVSLADPLRRFPGPSLAKWTRLYRVYYDVVVGGGWLSHLRDLHELYGEFEPLIDRKGRIKHLLRSSSESWAK
jgi:hypothetical protein